MKKYLCNFEIRHNLIITKHKQNITFLKGEIARLREALLKASSLQGEDTLPPAVS